MLVDYSWLQCLLTFSHGLVQAGLRRRQSSPEIGVLLAKGLDPTVELPVGSLPLLDQTGPLLILVCGTRLQGTSLAAHMGGLGTSR